MAVTALLKNPSTFQPGFQLSNADGTLLNSMVVSLNKASSQVNSILASGSTAALHGSFNGTVGSSTPAAGSFTRITGSSNAAITGSVTATGGVIRAISVASTAVSTVLQGILNISATVVKAYTLGAPVAGQDLSIICSGVSTTKRQAKAPAGVSIFGFLSSAAGSSKAKTSLNFTGKGQTVWLRGLSSVAYYVMGKAGNVAST